MKKILIVGATGGIGAALLAAALQRFSALQVTATWHRNPPSITDNQVLFEQLDLGSEDQISALAQSCGDLDVLINAVGLLHTDSHGPEKTIKRIDQAFFMENIRVNTLPTLLLAKHFHKNFCHERPSVFATLSAKVGSIEDNKLGGWTSYRCSKAALNMALKNISIEWQRSLPNVCVAALHPGTTDSRLSKPFQHNVPADKLFEPQRCAGHLWDVVDSLTPDKSGGFWSWDGKALPW